MESISTYSDEKTEWLGDYSVGRIHIYNLRLALYIKCVIAFLKLLQSGGNLIKMHSSVASYGNVLDYTKKTLERLMKKDVSFW